jgi:glutamate N-acetyltransferase/amino-acid N-acetyltransferase
MLPTPEHSTLTAQNQIIEVPTPTPVSTLPAAGALLPAGALPLGFQFAAVRAGIKPSGKPDLACVLAAPATRGAALFTSNRVVAAPVLVGRAHLVATQGAVRAVVVNSGNANCATGDHGMQAAQTTCAAAAEAFGCDAQQVIPSSTGIIGVPLPVEKLVAALPAVRDAFAATPEAFSQFARAILTTDTRPKVACRSVTIGDQMVRIAGACKGAGMIHPKLTDEPFGPSTREAAPKHATMLAYLFTDAAIDAALLQTLLRVGAEPTFNRISIDGDTSTNDTVLLLASGASGTSVTADDTNTVTHFQAALDAVCRELALAIVEDGEGVTHVVTLEISGAPDDAQALQVARAIAHSPLVKTAWAGGDPNWGRLASSIGASGVAIKPERLHITLDGLPVCEQGGRALAFDAAAVHAAMANRRFTIAVSLGLGEGFCRFWTTDLTTEYVHINADYSS